MGQVGTFKKKCLWALARSITTLPFFFRLSDATISYQPTMLTRCCQRLSNQVPGRPQVKNLWICESKTCQRVWIESISVGLHEHYLISFRK